jgi:histidinol-phosphate aminotransferase
MSSTDLPRPKPGVMDIAAYVPGRETVHGAAKVYKLSSNESPLGPSPKVAEAIAEKSADLAIYPDGSAHVLRDAISTRAWPQSGQHPVRQRIGRVARAAVPDISGSRR